MTPIRVRPVFLASSAIRRWVSVSTRTCLNLVLVMFLFPNLVTVKAKKSGCRCQPFFLCPNMGTLIDKIKHFVDFLRP